MDIKVYTTDGCFYCEQMKQLCKRAELDYQEVKISNKALSDLYPDANSYPYVTIDGEPIGGLVETAKYFLKEGLISVRKD